MYLTVATAAAVIAIVLVATGGSIPGVACFAVAVGLFVVAMRALFVGKT
jgi:hypothetical protein